MFFFLLQHPLKNCFFSPAQRAKKVGRGKEIWGNTAFCQKRRTRKANSGCDLGDAKAVK